MKYEMGSPAWMAALHGIIVEKAITESREKPNLKWSACEVYVNVPKHLSEDRLAWSCKVEGQDVDFQCTERDDVDKKTIADYDCLLPLARFTNTSDPARAAEFFSRAGDLVGQGKIQVIGQRPDEENSLSPTHDAIAKITL